ncbi:MAG: hypothetical protein GQ556_08425 [Desulfobacterales bacterium]|jgi:hypothetical protein|nr:hypothetical protein [Desulfobacterales bacterium]NOQ67223.1 hypothetical protein [Desulfobacterales bacterium]
MRPFTVKQLELLSELNHKANNFHIGGFKNQLDAGKLRSWKRFDEDIIEKIENKFVDIAMIGEEISSLTCILKNRK